MNLNQVLRYFYIYKFNDWYLLIFLCEINIKRKHIESLKTENKKPPFWKEYPAEDIA